MMNLNESTILAIKTKIRPSSLVVLGHHSISIAGFPLHARPLNRIVERQIEILVHLWLSGINLVPITTTHPQAVKI